MKFDIDLLGTGSSRLKPLLLLRKKKKIINLCGEKSEYEYNTSRLCCGTLSTLK